MPGISVEQAMQVAVQHHRNGRLNDAEALYRQVLAAEPGNVQALHYLGVVAGQTGHWDQALELIGRAIVLSPRQRQCYVNLGSILSGAGRLSEAERVYRQALQTWPEDPDFRLDLGASLERQGKMDEAMACYQEALRLKPDHAAALNNVGNVWKSKGELDKAQECYEKAVSTNRGLVEAFGNLGTICESRGKYERAIEWYQQALAIQPEHAGILYNLGVAQGSLERWQEAAASYQRAIRSKPDDPRAHSNLGNAYKALGDFDKAMASYEEALRLKPNLPEAFNNVACIYGLQGEVDKSISCHRRVMELKPDFVRAHSNLLYEFLVHPLYDAEMISRENAIWNQRHAEPLKHLIRPHDNERLPERRLRIGYVSPDFRKHVVARFMLPLLREHDRKQVELFCYCDVVVSDAVTGLVKAQADHWRETAALSDERVAELIRADEIDILVDLALHTNGNRLLVFARKPAPVQVSYLGYPGSTGLTVMDYRFTDSFIDPEGTDTSVYSEESVRLESYWCYEQLLETPPVNELPAVKNGYVTFGSLNNFCKASEKALELWGQLLLNVPESKLLLYAPRGSHRQRMVRWMDRMGVDPKRCEFFSGGDSYQCFEQYHRIDIGVDPVPCNGGTTTCDALWMGVPVVTLTGLTSVGRSGASILSNAGLPELIAHSEMEYLRLAADLAADLPMLQRMRESLRDRMIASRLMDAPRFARVVEEKYRETWRKWCATGT